MTRFDKLIAHWPMPAYSITATKTHFSRLVEQVANGESFIIAKSGKPMVKVVSFDTPLRLANRFGAFSTTS